MTSFDPWSHSEGSDIIRTVGTDQRSAVRYIGLSI